MLPAAAGAAPQPSSWSPPGKLAGKQPAGCWPAKTCTPVAKASSLSNAVRTETLQATSYHTSQITCCQLPMLMLCIRGWTVMQHAK